VHHGNGTEDIIAGDERVLMCSFFQHPLYPYSGAVPKGTNMVNVPIAPYTRGAGCARPSRTCGCRGWRSSGRR
jgi:acetoin utilization deacetylase AcuC-like enzyme